MAPFFTNDAIVLGLLILVLTLIFYTARLKTNFWKTFYTYIPALLLCYFLPAFLNWPLGLIAPHWYEPGLIDALVEMNVPPPPNIEDYSYEQINSFLESQGLKVSDFSAYAGHSQLYFMASRYLLPAALVLLCLGIDLQGFINLGPKALIMFLAATIGIVIGGPIALYAILHFAPGLITEATPEEIWRGLSTVAGSWIGGGANQTAMKEIFQVGDGIFASMIVVDVIVANIWMGFLLYGANIAPRVDRWLKSDTSAIEDLKRRVADYRSKIEQIPSTTDIFIVLGIGFGGTALAHWASDVIVPLMGGVRETLESYRLNSLLSPFFWLIVVATTFGLGCSFTRLKEVEGLGASKMGSVFIYILVATIGMKMNIAEIFANLGLFAIGALWMLIHVAILLIVAKIIRAPLFFVAVGSQANVGGAASAPIVASAFSPALAPVGVLMAVLGYAMGT
ncbi:MAG: DUF819 family protein, partial [Bacteroidetes bacterium]|nr:DUF819 family protein [Bacteroidota bacterium]